MAELSKYPVISLREFDSYMQEGGFSYSVLVLVMLEEAAEYVREANKWDNEDWVERWRGKAYLTQICALQTAEYEKNKGKLAEDLLPIIAMVTEKFARQIYEKWRGYLKKIGRDIGPIQEDAT